MIPCEECIVLAICRHRQQRITCNKLFKWMIDHKTPEWIGLESCLPYWRSIVVIKEDPTTCCDYPLLSISYTPFKDRS